MYASRKQANASGMTPSASLAHGTLYTVRLDSTVRDSFGMIMGAPTTWTFTTG